MRENLVVCAVAKAWMLWVCESVSLSTSLWLVRTHTHTCTFSHAHTHTDTCTLYNVHPYERANLPHHQYERPIRMNESEPSAWMWCLQNCRCVEACPLPMCMWMSVSEKFWYIENCMLAATGSAMDPNEMARCIHLSIDIQSVIFCVRILRLRLLLYNVLMQKEK